MTLAALQALAVGGDPVLVVTPADQTVTDADAFGAAVLRAVRAAADGAIVHPRHHARPARDRLRLHPRRRSRRRRRRAARRTVRREARTWRPPSDYLAAGGYFWNSGMFVLRASVWLAALERFRPDIAGGDARRLGRTQQRRQLRAARRGRVQAGAERVGRLRGDGEAAPDRRASTSAWCRSAPAGPTWAPGTRSGRSATRTPPATASVGDALLRDSRDTLVHATSRLVGVVGLDERGRRRDARRGAGGRPRPQPGVKHIVGELRSRRPHRADAAPPGAPPVGLVRQHRLRRALPGQAHHGQAGRHR